MIIKFLDIPYKLTAHIKEYESDTFAEKMTDIEAKAVAHFFLNRWAKGDINDLATDKLGIDGTQISEVLEWYRGGELKDEELGL